VKRSLVPLLVPLFGLAAVAFFCGAGTWLPGVPPIEEPLGKRLPLFFVVPFVALLAAIAFLPAVAGHWWEENVNKAKVAALAALPIVALLPFDFGWVGFDALLENFAEYVSLMAVLGALFIVCGGIVVEGTPRGTPLVNAAILAVGAVLANLIGTTGASMILIRPLLRANAHRRRIAHVPIFLIFIVANCGGLLTPLGDPPLFLGYLAGVPFGWTLRLFPAWLLVNSALLAIFLACDWIALARERRENDLTNSAAGATAYPSAAFDAERQTPDARRTLRVRGFANIALLLLIVGIVFAGGRGLLNGGVRWPFGVQEVLFALLAIVSLRFTRRELREQNRFSFKPIVEVAVLFAGIFVTMTPALAILHARGSGLGLTEPWHYFWASGLFSSVLDNAPTYLAFTATAAGAHGLPAQGRFLAHALERPEAGLAPILAAISCGCVFMGALTYIGNGPNFMVRAIAQESNVQMPGFVKFTVYAAMVLVPLFAVVTIVFFR
jgi:Na+/H+ antiporter NhaD/arsenite permease-like protein